MARVKPVYKPADYAGLPGQPPAEDVEALFGRMFPGVEAPEIDRPHAGFAVLARNPRLALHVLELTQFIARDLAWTERRDLRELAVQTVNLHFKCGFSFEARAPNAEALGLRAELLAAIPYWRTTGLFDDAQQLVIEYALAVCAGEVSDELFARAAASFGEQGAVELTATVGLWSFWAMVLNAIQP
jgi:4-carboxymuconolactone decarboxylase